MDFLMQYFTSLDLPLVAKIAILLLGVPLVLALVGRFVFGKKSTLCRSVSSAIGILFIYAIIIAVGSLWEDYRHLATSLPFVSVSSNSIALFSFDANYTIISSQLLSMVILAFLMNLAESLLPTGKRALSWIFFRILGITMAIALHLIVTQLLVMFLPEGIMTYAPVILLAILVLMLLTGCLKFLVGLALTTVNPLIAALYTFFFANIIGKQITKALLTTALLTALVIALQALGIMALSIAAAALVIYIPLIILLVLFWYLVGKLL